MAQARASMKLSFTSSVCATDESRPEVSIIAIAGFGTIPVDRWNVKEIRYAAESGSSVSRLHFYTYQHIYKPKGEFLWSEYLKTASDLAEALARLAVESPLRPIIIIAHSLGGTLLKKALLLIHQNLQNSKFRQFVEKLCAIVFLGTPHAGISDDDTLQRHNQVLVTYTRSSEKQSKKVQPQVVYELASLSATFEQIANLPILSVYEIEMPKRSGLSFLGKKTKPLVDEQLATISSSGERMLGVERSHNELCDLSRLRETNSAGHFFRRIFQDLQARQGPTVNDGPTQQAKSSSDPLNPLNLVAIEPSEKGNSSSAYRVTAEARSAGPPAFNLSHRLHLLTKTSTERLLQTRSSKLPCFNVPQEPNPNFIGRQDTLKLMDRHLLKRGNFNRAEDQSTRIFSLCGMGGIGKTDLAIEYAFSRRREFQAVFWLEASGVSQLATDFSRIATHLCLESPDEAKDIESSIEIAKAWLSRPWDPQHGCNVSWLIIFDNADNLDIIANYIPYEGNGSIVITSRDPFAKEQFFTNGTGIDIDPLSASDSATLLCNLTRRKDEAQEPDEIDASMTVATHFDGLPLAVTQMAGFIRKRQLSIREFVNLYANDVRYLEVHDIGNPAQQRRYGATLATAFNFQDVSPNALLLLQQCAFLNPDRIREDIFVTKETTNNMWTMSTLEEARYELLASSIIKRVISKKELWIHRVIQAEVRIRMEERERNTIFKTALYLLARIWPPGNLISQVSKRWALCEDLLPHLERLYQLYLDYAQAWEQYEMDAQFPRLLNEAAVYLHERGFSHEGKVYLKLALTLCKQANISEEPLLSDMHLTMGALSNETNDPRACLEHNILSLTIRKAEAVKAGKPDLRLAFAHSQMGIAYMMIRKYAQATEYFKQSVELLKSIEVDPDEFGFPVCNLGVAFWIQGELEDADRILTGLLDQRAKLHGKLDRVSYKTGRVLQGLGNVKSSQAKRLEEQGELVAAQTLWEKSFAIHQDCLRQYESTLGKFNHRTADACHKLAEHYIRRKEHDAAQEYLDRALSIWGDRQWFRNESSRSSFLRGIHLLSLGGEDNIEQGRRWVDRAKLLRKDILLAQNEQEEDLEEKELDISDFDRLVCFWSI